MALIPPHFLDCVTAIGFRDTSGKIAFGATGFLYGKLATAPEEPAEKKKYRVYLVTNRHVFEGEKVAVLRFNPHAGAPAQTFDLVLTDRTGAQLYSLHPDPKIDIAAIGINIALLKRQNIQFAFFASDCSVMTLSQAQKENISEGDGVFVLGFPLGDPGNQRNYVVVRQGVLARVRDAVLGASPTFLVDASIFPGNSGGPVITKPEVVAIDGTTAHSKADLIGIVTGYVTYQDVAISIQSKRPRIVFEENTGLATVLPVDRIMEAVDVADAAILARQRNSSLPGSCGVT